MTTVSLPTADTAATTPPPVPFSRTVIVQSRKLVTTTSGFWLVLALALSTAGVVAARALLLDVSVATAYTTSGVTLSTLLPAIAAVTMASEFGSATTAGSFLLEPRRARVVLAQCVPLVGMAVASSVLALVVAIGAVWVASSSRGTAMVWSLDAPDVVGSTLIIVLLMLAGAALGLLLLNIPLTLVISLPSTMFWSTVALVSDTGARLREWMDLGTAAGPLSDLAGGLDLHQLTRLGVAVTITVVAPFALGLLRTVRREVK